VNRPSALWPAVQFLDAIGASVLRPIITKRVEHDDWHLLSAALLGVCSAPSRHCRRFRQGGPDSLSCAGRSLPESADLAIPRSLRRNLASPSTRTASPTPGPRSNRRLQRQADLDVVERADRYCLRGGERGWLTSSISRNSAAMPRPIVPLIRWPTSSYSSVLPNSQKKSRRRRRPNNWARFLGREEVPGPPRAAQSPDPTLEAALMADGVAPTSSIRSTSTAAFKKLEEIKAQHHGVVDLGAQSRTAP